MQAPQSKMPRSEADAAFPSCVSPRAPSSLDVKPSSTSYHVNPPNHELFNSLQQTTSLFDQLQPSIAIATHEARPGRRSRGHREPRAPPAAHARRRRARCTSWRCAWCACICVATVLRCPRCDPCAFSFPGTLAHCSDHASAVPLCTDDASSYGAGSASV